MSIKAGLLSVLLVASASYASPLAISPPSATVSPKQSVAFTASGGSGSGYVWAFVTNASQGTLTATGSYAAGPMGDVSDTIQVEDSLGEVDTATITVTAALSITPAHMNVYPNLNEVFFADGGSGSGYVWSYIANNSGGILYPTGQYTSGPVFPSEDTIGLTDSVGATATATISVYGLLRLQPGLPTVQPGQTLLFTASGGSGQYLWSLYVNESGGTISQSGLYTAGPKPYTSDTVLVTDATLGWDTGDLVTVTAASCSGLGAAFLPLSLLPLVVSRRPRKRGEK